MERRVSQVICGTKRLVVRLIVSVAPRASAVTFGSDIFVRRILDPSSRIDMALLAHEVTHVGDCPSLGTLRYLFAAAYDHWYLQGIRGINPYDWSSGGDRSFGEYRLEQRGRLSEADLREGIRYCERNSRVRLPPLYLARWLHSRLGPLAANFEREGVHAELTVELIDEMLQAEQVGQSLS